MLINEYRDNDNGRQDCTIQTVDGAQLGWAKSTTHTRLGQRARAKRGSNCEGRHGGLLEASGDGWVDRGRQRSVEAGSWHVEPNWVILTGLNSRQSRPAERPGKGFFVCNIEWAVPEEAVVGPGEGSTAAAREVIDRISDTRGKEGEG